LAGSEGVFTITEERERDVVMTISELVGYTSEWCMAPGGLKNCSAPSVEEEK